MSNCGCDDGIGMYVCRQHSTPHNDVFYYMFHHSYETGMKKEEKDCDEEQVVFYPAGAIN